VLPNLQDLLTGKYHLQKNLEKVKRIEDKSRSAQRWEMKKKQICEREAQYVVLSSLLQSTTREALTPIISANSFIISCWDI
jgi:hypothetical protein